MAKTTKVLDITEMGAHITCVRDNEAKMNKYSVYYEFYTWDGNFAKKHKKKLVSYEEFDSVLVYVRDLFNHLKNNSKK